MHTTFLYAGLLGLLSVFLANQVLHARVQPRQPRVEGFDNPQGTSEFCRKRAARLGAAVWRRTCNRKRPRGAPLSVHFS